MLRAVILAVVFGLMGAWMVAQANAEGDDALYRESVVGHGPNDTTFSPNYWEEEYKP